MSWWVPKIVSVNQTAYGQENNQYAQVSIYMLNPEITIRTSLVISSPYILFLSRFHLS